MSHGKFPRWIGAVGSKIAKKFDVSSESLSLEIDLMLRLVSEREEPGERCPRDAARR